MVYYPAFAHAVDEPLQLDYCRFAFECLDVLQFLALLQISLVKYYHVCSHTALKEKEKVKKS
jgi:hypothetical protein